MTSSWVKNKEATHSESGSAIKKPGFSLNVVLHASNPQKAGTQTILQIVGIIFRSLSFRYWQYNFKISSVNADSHILSFESKKTSHMTLQTQNCVSSPAESDRILQMLTKDMDNLEEEVYIWISVEDYTPKHCLHFYCLC